MGSYLCFCVQIEQEMGLGTGSVEIKGTFFSNWRQFVPAILRYGRNSGKKLLLSVLETLDETGKIDLCSKQFNS